MWLPVLQLKSNNRAWPKQIWGELWNVYILRAPGGWGHPHLPNALMLIQTEAGRPFGLSDRAENSGSSEECKGNKLIKHWNIYTYIYVYIYVYIYIGCPNTYQTRHSFNNSKTNEDILKRFEQEYVRCVRNEEGCVCSACLFRCNVFIGFRIIKEMPGLVSSGTPCTYGLCNLYKWRRTVYRVCSPATWRRNVGWEVHSANWKKNISWIK